MRRTVGLVLAWVAATLVALVAASAAVRVVADQVANELPPPLPEEYLPDPTATTDPGATTSPTPGLPVPTVDVGPASESTETRTVHTSGGSTALRFSGGAVTVLWATPNAGYTVSTEGSGTHEAHVEFRSQEGGSRVKAEYEDGEPDIEVDEQDEDERAEDHDGDEDD